MFDPIVKKAVKQANVYGLKTIEEWMRIEDVKNRYSQGDLKPKFDEQIERYGERMMEIYKLVEKTGTPS